VILAVGEKVDPDFCRASGLTLKDEGTIEVDRYSLETSRERFYAGGDLITGASNVSNAMGYGKKAARNIDRKLMGHDRFAELEADFVYAMEPPETPSELGRHVPGEMPAATRVQSYAEVSLGLTAVAAMEETARCLRCDIRSAER
jgi:NADPH-dependent glutamate synthase beta subunit-like oxidoreductase